MAFLEQTEIRLQWRYNVPGSKDRTLWKKALLTLAITWGALIVCEGAVGISMHAPIMDILQLVGVVGGFVTVVVLLAFGFTALVLRLLTGKENPYLYTSDETGLIICGVTETKGGKHLRYSHIKALALRPAQGNIFVRSTLGTNLLWGEAEDLPVIWAWLKEHCPQAEFTEDNNV